MCTCAYELIILENRLHCQIGMNIDKSQIMRKKCLKKQDDVYISISSVTGMGLSFPSIFFLSSYNIYPDIP
mgnify:CR=1 FL=1